MTVKETKTLDLHVTIGDLTHDSDFLKMWNKQIHEYEKQGFEFKSVTSVGKAIIQKEVRH